jgi:arylsulfatase A-like enzyme
MQVKILAIIISGLLFLTTGLAAQQPDNKPNIILILADDMGWGDIRSNGNPLIETPVLDRLAEKSLSFDRFYVCPLCAPTRAEILTGRYFLRTGVSSVTQGYENMNPRETTFAEILKQNGYATGCFGKWHNGGYFLQHPNRKGFDEYVGFMVGHLGYYYDAIYQHNDTDVKSEGYATDYFTRQALGFIERNAGKPFLCYVPYNVPHSPFQVPEKYFGKYKNRGLDNELATIYGMVENMDQNIGLILSKLEQLNLAEKTIVIFLSDNGPNTFRFNGEMKGKKGNVDEGGVRVPFYISWPGTIEAGKTAQLAQGIDLFPTLLKLCSINYKPVLPIDGVDLSKTIFKQAENLDRYIYSRQPQYPLQGRAGSIRNNRYRLTIASGDTLLYDMQNDPSQKVNIAEKYPEIRDKLAADYKKWEEEMVSGYQPQTTIEAGFEGERSITLPVQNAILSGKVKYSSIHPNQSHTENWVENSDSIYWKLNMHHTGKYRVELQYGCPETDTGSKFLFQSNAGSFTFRIDKAFESVILPDRDYVKRTESVERTWEWMPVGTISLKAGQEKLTLKLTDKKKNEAGLIKAIRLIKI